MKFYPIKYTQKCSDNGKKDRQLGKQGTNLIDHLVDHFPKNLTSQQVELNKEFGSIKMILQSSIGYDEDRFFHLIRAGGKLINR